MKGEAIAVLVKLGRWIAGSLVEISLNLVAEPLLCFQKGAVKAFPFLGKKSEKFSLLEKELLQPWARWIWQPLHWLWQLHKIVGIMELWLVIGSPVHHSHSTTICVFNYEPKTNPKHAQLHWHTNAPSCSCLNSPLPPPLLGRNWDFQFLGHRPFLPNFNLILFFWQAPKPKVILWQN